MKPLSVGNVVSAGLRIYRDNFKKYFKLAFFGYLWVFVPVYGWAKYSQMMGSLARLAYGEVSEQPESVSDAQRHTKPRMWDFFVTGLLVSMIIFGAIIPFVVVISIISAVVGGIFGSQAGGIIGGFLIFVGVLVLIFGLIWLISRLFLVELPLAVEENTTAVSTIKRSWELTQGSVGRIQLILFIAFLISIPILVATQIVSFIVQMMIGFGIEQLPILAVLGGVLSIALSIASGAFMIPFWQSIKGVLYHDLRVRREGMGIDLRK